MPSPSNRSDVRLDVAPGQTERPAKPEAETPFHVAVLGDFSGRASRGEKRGGDAIAATAPRQIDRDNVDETMERLAVTLDLPVAGRIRFGSLDEFRPDSLYQRLEMFRKLEEAKNLAGEDARRAPPPPSQAPGTPPDLSLDGLLDQAVEATAGQTEGRETRSRDPFREWLDEQVAPHTEAAPDPRAEELAGLVHKAANAQMRALMHFPAFQELEAAWRGVDFLVRRVETSTQLKIFLLDVTKQELSDDLRESEDLAGAGLVRVLADMQDTGGWSLLAGNYSFGPDVEDISLLARLGRIGRAFNAPFLAAGDPSLAGARSLLESPDPNDWEDSPETWQVIRKHPAALFVALFLPRFLERLPYGAATSPCEQFPYEEMENPPAHADYLWGNPALLGACLIAEAFSRSGWDMRPEVHQNLSRLPLHTYKRDGGFVNQPCAEVVMSERLAQAIGERGLSAVASIRDTDEVRLVRLQSIADPVRRLHGRW